MRCACKDCGFKQFTTDLHEACFNCGGYLMGDDYGYDTNEEMELLLGMDEKI